MTDQTPATEAAAEVLLMFVLGKDVPHHVRRVVTDFVPRIQKQAREQGVRMALDHERQGRAGTHLYDESCPLCDPDD